PSRKDISRVIITRDCILGNSSPEYVLKAQDASKIEGPKGSKSKDPENKEKAGIPEGSPGK
ncbi:MAG: hypothetical protein J5933_03995, partial [Clostridia bacterium]|nr:hypothetical protein [Clostridia bacterium]